MKVNLVRRKVLAGKDKDKVCVFGQVKCSEKIVFDKLCERISAMSSATKGDVELVIDGLLHVMKNHLSLGNIVQLGDLGNFRLTAGSRGVDDPEEFHASMMKKPSLVFAPGLKLKYAMETAPFGYWGVKREEVDEECLFPHE